MIRSDRLMVAAMATLAALFIFLPAIHAQDAAPKTQQQDAPEIAQRKLLKLTSVCARKPSLGNRRIWNQYRNDLALESVSHSLL